MSGTWPTTPLTVITPVRAGQEQELAETVNGLAGDGSPFERLSSTHFAHMVVIGQVGVGTSEVPRVRRRLRGRYLVFTAEFNSPVDDFVEELRVRLAVAVDEIWGRCIGYPGREPDVAFHRYFRTNTVPVLQRYAAYDATVEEVLNAVDIRRQHIELAVQSQTMSPDQLLDEFRRRFPRP